MPAHLTNQISRLVLACALWLAAAPHALADQISRTWALAEFGEPRHKQGMPHFPYVNPDAPKGGRIVLGWFGSFDSFNPFILKGEWPYTINLIYDQLMVPSDDELMSVYGSIAETAEYPADKSWIAFNLRPEARYSDGVAITADDFCFAFDTYKTHGRPLIKSFIQDLETCEVLNDHKVKFTARTRDSMKPLMIAAEFTPMPRHFWEKQDVTKTTLVPPPASGGYRIAKVDPGRSITYERVRDFWGADLPVHRGRYNIDVIHFEHYRDQTVMFEAFKAGKIDAWRESSSKRWATGYDVPAVADGRLVRRTEANAKPRGLGGYFFNSRRPQFQDRRVRRAIAMLYDFETIRVRLLHGHYKRVKSYFPNSDYGASGPPGPAELAILEPYRGQLPPEVFTEAFEPPKTDGSGRIRRNLRQALKLFKDAGWILEDNRLVNRETGEQLRFAIITASPESERTTLPFVDNLRRAGIDASLRLLDVAQWRNAIDQLDFDVYIARNNFFPPPGTELRLYFGSDGQGRPAPGNRTGFIDPVADALIDQIVAARDLETLKNTTRALDRVLLWNFNVVPQYYPDEAWFAYWDKFGIPNQIPRYALDGRESEFRWIARTWWIDPQRERSLAAR